MQHVDQATLDAVLNHQLSDAQLAKIKEHVRSCRMCARRLEEYRDLFSEVEVIIPTAERNRVSKPGVGRTWRDVLTPRLDDALPSSDRMLKIGMGAVTVLVLGVVVFLMRSPTRSVAPIVLAPHPQVTAPAAPAPQPTTQATPPAPAPTRAAVPAPTPPPAATPVRTTTETTPPPRRQKPVADPPTRAAVATPVAPDNSHTPLFHRVESTEAIGALGGSMRLVDGVTPDHFEMAPGTVVPGAAETLPVIRVVYKLYGGTILLDQQRNPEQASRDSASGTAPEGVSVLRWSSGDFWLTLAGRVPADSLELLARRVK